MSDLILVTPVASWRDRRRFQALPWAIYAPPGARRDPHWVPPILAQERDLLGWPTWRGARHPFFDNAEITVLLARREGRTLGRLAVLVNHIHNRTHDDRLGFFGFFECVDDPAVARALFDAGAAWLRRRGMTAVRGPVNPSLNYTCGLLVDGFDRPPCFLMTYNPPYYAALLESCGFAKSQDLFAYEMDDALLAGLVARYKPAVLAALERTRLVVRPMDPARFQQEILTYLDIYNRSLDGTWGFTPLQPREARHIASSLRRVIVPRFAIFAEIAGQPVGALLALLDYNQVLKDLDGRLFPFGLLKLLLRRRRISAVRVMAMTMVPGYQSSGLSVVLLDRLAWGVGTDGRADGAARWGIRRYECSWVLESNSQSRGTLNRTGMKIVSTYRLYDKAL